MSLTEALVAVCVCVYGRSGCWCTCVRISTLYSCAPASLFPPPHTHTHLLPRV